MILNGSTNEVNEMNELKRKLLLKENEHDEGKYWTAIEVWEMFD
jgi:hypothetical protein